MFGNNKKEMMSAVNAGDVEKVTVLLDKGTDPNFGYYRNNPLYLAIANNNLDIVSLLLDRGAADNDSIIHGAIYYDRPEPLPMLAEHGIKPKIADLIFAVKKGNFRITEWMLENNPDLLQKINERNDGMTALHRAAEHGYAKIAAYLLSKGADPNIEDYENRTSLFRAQEKNNKEVEALLIPVTTNVVTPRTADLQAQAGWKKLNGEKRVALVTVDPEIGYRITEVFNFQSRDCLKIVRNIESGAEAVETRSFDEITDKAPLEAAAKALSARGGKVDAGDISGLRKGGMGI
jgi:hypothetical protein